MEKNEHYHVNSDETNMKLMSTLQPIFVDINKMFEE